MINSFSIEAYAMTPRIWKFMRNKSAWILKLSSGFQTVKCQPQHKRVLWKDYQGFHGLLNSELVNSGSKFHQHIGISKTGPRFKKSSDRPEEQGVKPLTPGLVIYGVNHRLILFPFKQYFIYLGYWGNRMYYSTRLNPRPMDYQLVNMTGCR